LLLFVVVDLFANWILLRYGGDVLLWALSKYHERMLIMRWKKPWRTLCSWMKSLERSSRIFMTCFMTSYTWLNVHRHQNPTNNFDASLFPVQRTCNILFVLITHKIRWRLLFWYEQFHHPPESALLLNSNDHWHHLLAAMADDPFQIQVLWQVASSHASGNSAPKIQIQVFPLVMWE